MLLPAVELLASLLSPLQPCGLLHPFLPDGLRPS